MKSLKESFTSEYMAKLEGIGLKYSSSGVMIQGGIRRSKKTGSSLEFADFRDYSAGDDLRRVDWNGYARTGKMFIKLYEEERQANFSLLLDTSESMNCYNKSFFSRFLAASIAYLVLKNTDNLNLYTVSVTPDSTLQKPSSPASMVNISGLRRFVQVLDFFDSAVYGASENSESFAARLKILPGVCFIVSDFFCAPEKTEALIKALQAKHQSVILMHVMSEEELNPSLNGELLLKDSETALSQNMYIDQGVLDLYRSGLESFMSSLRGLCAARGAAYALAPSNKSVLEVLL